MSDALLIVGRGASAYGFDWKRVRCPIMAVSSGIFAIPRDVHCDHFCSLDEPRNYMSQLMEYAPHSWGNDRASRYWPFWADASIVKHVVRKRIRTVTHNPLPIREIVEAIKEWAEPRHEDPRIYIDAVYAELGDQMGQFGLQPGWGDYQNLRGWTTKAARRPVWDGDGPVSIWRPRGSKSIVYNTLEMAVQVAARLGFRTQHFIGVDLVDEGYTGLVGIMREWHVHAERAGIRWLNLSPRSALREFIDSSESLEVAA